MFDFFKNHPTCAAIKSIFRLFLSSDTKEKTSHKKITNIRMSSFSKFNFEQLAFLNLLKLNYLIKGVFASPSLEEYQLISLLELVKCEEDFVYKGFVSVVNCSALFIIDYFGNKNNYYNNLIDNLNRQFV